MPDYRSLRQQAIKTLPSGAKVFAGQADDSFFLDLRVFNLLYGGKLKEVGNDTLRGYNVQTRAIQVPTRALIKPGQPIIGVYSATGRGNAGGGNTQVSRLGMPLVNEVVIPIKDKDRFNASVPWHDAQFLKYVTNPELPKLLQAIYKLPAPAEPRNDRVQTFLTGVPGLNKPPNVRPAELMRLNTSIPPAKDPKRLGVLDGDKAGYPNGRRLTDDVLDISLQVVAGELVGKKNDLGDAVNSNDVAFEKSFPYVALRASGSVPRGAKAGKTGSLFNFGQRSAGSPEGGGGMKVVPIVALTAGTTSRRRCTTPTKLSRSTAAGCALTPCAWTRWSSWDATTKRGKPCASPTPANPEYRSSRATRTYWSYGGAPARHGRCWSGPRAQPAIARTSPMWPPN
jgi:uncharacterized protein DUF4331